MRTIAALFALSAFVARPAHAESGFAEPPGEVLVTSDAPIRSAEPEPEPELPAVGSTVRVSVGPGLRVSGDAPDGGLVAALDAGSGAVGARVAGSWVRVGSPEGLSQYQAELWVDFGAGRRLHPILGAGAGVARVDHEGSDGAAQTATYGVGVLRGTLEYVLPVERADARAGLDVLGTVPAAYPRNAPDPGAWLLFVARVGVGF
jgi:hypothetical protein